VNIKYVPRLSTWERDLALKFSTLSKKNIHTSATDLAILRQKAKELIKLKPSKVQIPLSEAETLKRLNELEVLQIELEMQNEELKQTISSLESLRESEQTLKEYIDNSIDVIHTVNIKGEFLYVSGAWERYFGLPVSAAVGKEFVEFIIPEDREKCSEYVRRVLKTGDPEKSPVYRVRVADGSLRWIVTNGKSYVDIHGSLIFIGVSHDITERIEAEEALRNSENRFSLSMDATSDGLWDWEIPSGKTYFSPGYFRMLGYEPNEYEHTFNTWKNLIHPEDVDAAISNKMECLNNITQNVQVEFRMKAKDGSWRWILGRGKAVERDIDGKAIRMIGTHVDITQRKLIEEDLSRKESMLKITGLTAKVGGWEIDAETLSIYWSEEVYRIHELNFEFIPDINKTIDFYAPECRPAIMNAITRAIKFGESFDLELEFITDKGNHKWVQSIGKALQENGKTKKVIGSIQDITARKKVEKELIASEALYRAIINASPYLITICDLNGRIKMYSPATSKLFGYEDSKEIIGRLVTDFLVPLERERAMGDIKLRLRGTKTGPNEYLAEHADGSNFYFEVMGEFIHNVDGQPTEMVLIGRDVTDRKKTEMEIKLKNDELIKLNAEKDLFFSIISHDLRSPFNGFLGFTKTLAEQVSSLTPDEIHTIASGMNKSATSLFGLLENLLQWARIQQGLMPFVPVQLHLDRIANRNIEMVKQYANSKGIRIRNKIQDDTLVFADKNMLQTIFRNLLSNAIKFTPNGGKISISAKIFNEELLVVSIKDSGIGMNPDLIRDLFRIDKKTNRKGTLGEYSSGLGLVLCKEFVERHKGKIWVESKVDEAVVDPISEGTLYVGNNSGSTFHFTIPCAKI
jgi:PAS domain S-box-containing protein